MPVGSFHMDILGRAAGRSAQKQAAYGSGTTIKTVPIKSIVAAASYRAGEKLLDETLGRTFDYSDRDDVVYTDMMLPDNAPEWAADRQALWNAVEQREKHVRAQLARSVMIGLPRELTLEQNVALVREFLHEHFVSKGVVADYAIHDKEASDGGRNIHAHVLVGMRGFNQDGTWLKNKARDLNGYDPYKTHDKHGKFIPPNQRFFSLDDWRDAWEKLQNAHLAAAGSDARVSLKSYAELGIDLIPTFHLGFEDWEKEKRGIRTASGDKNREIQAENQRRAWERAAANDNQMQQPAANDAKAADNAAQRQDDRLRDDTPGAAQSASADALKQREKEVQNTWDKQRQWMKDTLAGWQHYWDKQAERVQQGYTTLTSKATYEKIRTAFGWGAQSQQPQQQRTEEHYQQKPRRVWSQEQRNDYRQLQPYLQQQADLSKKERAHAIAATLQYAEQKRAEERRSTMQRIAERQANSRYRSIEQDRPLPNSVRERTRERGR